MAGDPLSDYYDLDSILADEERVPVRFLTDVYKLGSLDATCADRDLKANSVVELPYWLVQPLSRRTIAAIQLPSFYSKRARTALLASPEIFNLCDKGSTFFYDLGVKLGYLTQDANLLATLLQAYVVRYRRILDRSKIQGCEDHHDFVRGLSASERRLLSIGQHSSTQYARWKNGRVRKLNSSQFVVSRKRTFAELNRE